jgi:type II secretory pathway pseudopilin PulG
MHRRHGWILMDTVAAMVLLSFLAGVLAVGVNRQQTGLLRLENSRAASRLAESALLCLQDGRDLPKSADGWISVRRLATTSPGNLAWIKVTAIVQGRSSELIGLAPAGGQP